MGFPVDELDILTWLQGISEWKAPLEIWRGMDLPRGKAPSISHAVGRLHSLGYLERQTEGDNGKFLPDYKYRITTSGRHYLREQTAANRKKQAKAS